MRQLVTEDLELGKVLSPSVNESTVPYSCCNSRSFPSYPIYSNDLHRCKSLNCYTILTVVDIGLLRCIKWNCGT